MISIHTALAGCDMKDAESNDYIIIFQSTQPSQAVTLSDAEQNTEGLFQSTQPSQAVTIFTSALISLGEFQSTQPSQAVTNIHKIACDHRHNFNPHSPRRL